MFENIDSMIMITALTGIIGGLGVIATIRYQRKSKRDKSNIKQNINAGAGSTNYQSAGDMNIGKSDD